MTEAIDVWLRLLLSSPVLRSEFIPKWANDRAVVDHWVADGTSHEKCGSICLFGAIRERSKFKRCSQMPVVIVIVKSGRRYERQATGTSASTKHRHDHSGVDID